MNDKPNILFINTDQHSWNALSAYGNKWLKTPNIDRLHENGISFARSYCTDPVCSPARASWMTGRYTSECGMPFNGGFLHEDIPDLGEILNANGYNAFHCGKWHVPGRESDKGFRILYQGRRRIGAGGAEIYDPASTHAVVDFLTSYSDEKPFYLQVGFVNPHDVCECLHNYEERSIPGPLEQGVFSEDELPPLPENFEYDQRETVLQIVFRRTDNPLNHSAILNGIRDFDELQWRMFIWNYYRYIEKVDQEIGLVLNAFEGSRFKDNTLIIFSVDHGESAGCHRMFQKCTLYEESIHVPFIVASFGNGFSISKNTFDREHFISDVDLLSTVCDYADVAVPEDVQGMSVRPLVEGTGKAWREFAFVESNYWGRAIISDRYKYVCEYIPKDNEDFIPPDPDTADIGLEQLFDLIDNPEETKNLAGEPEHRDELDRLRRALQNFERTLNRRVITKEKSRDKIRHWSNRIREYWQSHPESREMAGNTR